MENQQEKNKINTEDIEDLEPVANTIKIGRFEYKSKNFWLTAFVAILIFIIAMSCIFSYTTLKIIDSIWKTPTTNITTNAK